MRILLLAFALLSAVAAGATDARTYAVDAAASVVAIHVGKAGLFKFAGHEHEILATDFQGTVVADADDLARSSLHLSFAARGLKVSTKGEPPDDVPKVQEAMVGPKLLEAAQFPTVVFQSTGVGGRRVGENAYELQVTGDLTLHGLTRRLTLPVHLEVAPEALTASGRFVLQQTDFGLSPISVGGVVKVKNEIPIDYRIVARFLP